MEIQNLNNKTRQKVIELLHETGMSVNRLAKETGVLQPNLHIFINGKGLSVRNLEKIWNYINKRGE